MGEFEDAWEDELESDSGEDIIDGEAEHDAIYEEEEEDGEKQGVKVYLPGQQLEKGQVLEVDNSAYDMLHSMNVRWPCLSFDVLTDNLGVDRCKYPHTAYLVAGTQADKSKNNELIVMKMAQLHRTRYDDDEDTDNEDEEDDHLDDDPILEHRAIPHYGGVNRVRVTPQEDQQIVATWADTGKVHLWDIQSHVASLAKTGAPLPKQTSAIYTVNHHAVEGYAMDWSSRVAGRLLTGDGHGKIFMTMTNGVQFQTDSVAFQGHQGSVEDLQWSPTEETVFASCSADRTIRIWDTRAQRTKEAIGFEAHTADVNVITWNHRVSYLLASGSDDGIFSVWDMRTLATGAGSSTATTTPVASFKWHHAPITSIEWCPSEESVLAVSGADDQLTIWDLSVEPDPEEEAAMATDGQGTSVPVPPQLLFIHQGQTDIKELHWHRQIPGCVASTAASGFNIFKTISV
ncbi:WD40-repeat-containing domain protein [Syncephalis pseudoplumigaleata]|uniref:Glutamate-rich WD repeat-containing protein 1 n=1 Tax=Syncephalis pseudoplumigaleata TaxID=1712513 RepID=A0A4P9Z127_9FUNG|nr:WD40-repeat-containing domain protein [Syncephalis pseudoplumigaleata]|eukprot:RKP26167.1 WD40-repeat-containing domain protein [Syncephalis pseudoplumigaleata]